MPPVVTKDNNAIEKYLAEVSANPKSAEAHANLGWGYYGKGQLPEALKSFREALALDGSYLEAHYGLALTYKASGSKTEAIAAFDQALALAAKVDDPSRHQMLIRLIRGHINAINTGDWNLGKPEMHG